MYIFVFGSNLAGRHGAGAAKQAFEHWGATYYRGEGFMMGKMADHEDMASYGIATKDKEIKPRPLLDIECSVNKFLVFARNSLKIHPDWTFLVTRIGCGRAGYTNVQIAPMFQEDTPDNCEFDPAWFPYGLKTWKVAPNEAAKELSRRTHETAIP